MDAKEFEAELAKYRIVRSADWKRDWSKPKLSGSGTASAAPTPVAAASSPAVDRDVNMKTPNSAVSAAPTAQPSVAAAADFAPTLNQFLSQFYSADLIPQISAEFASKHAAFVGSLSLDDIEALALFYEPTAPAATATAK